MLQPQEEAVRLITVDYEILPFVLDQEATLRDDAVKIWPEGNISPDARNQFQPAVQKHGNDIPPYAETQNYVKTVMQLYAMLKPPTLPGRIGRIARPAARSGARAAPAGASR